MAKVMNEIAVSTMKMIGRTIIEIIMAFLILAAGFNAVSKSSQNLFHWVVDRRHRFRAGGRVLRKTKEKRGKESGEVSWTKARLIDRSIVFTLSTEQ